MLSTLFWLTKPILHKMDPEMAHNFTLGGLSILGKLLWKTKYRNPLETPYITLPSRLGLAAGFDKNATATEALLKMGFGFVEIGTVTPLPQRGNQIPRLFRLEEDEAVINRMGFNNDGAHVIAKRLEKIRHKGNKGVIGVNIGANKDSDDRIADYALCANYFLETASYFTVNVSSPNTHGLRNLQSIEFLDRLLTDVLCVAHRHTKIPVFLKIAPDQQDYDLGAMIELINKLPIAGIIATNTTVSRFDGLISEHRGESGGLSGKPLFHMSTALLTQIRPNLAPDKLLIGVGGINSGKDAITKIQSGADAVQIYSGLVYKGKSLVNDINKQLRKV